eukprot:2706140-Pyramimonas_sp.AAC.1
MAGVQYDAQRASQTGKELSDMIKEKVKTMGFDRYKLVVQISDVAGLATLLLFPQHGCDFVCYRALSSIDRFQ